MLDMQQIGYFLYMEAQEDQQDKDNYIELNNDPFDNLELGRITQDENEKEFYNYP